MHHIYSILRNAAVLVCIHLFFAENMYAQNEQLLSSTRGMLDTIPVEARNVFYKYAHLQDTARLQTIKKYSQDSFYKRFSFHTNIVDWVTLLPNLGIEYDLKSSPRNNYSLSVFGKYNGNSKNGKFVYNVKSLRLEFRKYWRTGKYGSLNRHYDDFEKIHTDMSSIYYNADSLAAYSYYVDSLGSKAKALGIDLESIRASSDMTPEQLDSLDFAEDSLGIKTHRFRNWFYNKYHQFRRNVISGRTLENPRNWRAYYLGLWSAIDDWDISLTGKGKAGYGFGLGVVAGYTLPLLPQKYPKEGSLDLDLGLAVGWKAVKYDAYVYDGISHNYINDISNSQDSWKIVPYPVIQDVHVSLVWRFRGIKNKVHKSLIDDYLNQVLAYQRNMNEHMKKYNDVVHRREELDMLIKNRIIEQADSTRFWNEFHKRRILNAMKIKPDTVFGEQDMKLYYNLVKGIKEKELEKLLKQREDSISKLQKIEAKRLRKSLKEAQK